MTTHVGMLLYPKLTQLDLTGPFELFHRVPDVAVHLAWKTTDVVHADSGLGLAPTTTLAACPPLDVLFVPGGYGQIEHLMNRYQPGSAVQDTRIGIRPWTGQPTGVKPVATPHSDGESA